MAATPSCVLPLQGRLGGTSGIWQRSSGMWEAVELKITLTYSFPILFGFGT